MRMIVVRRRAYPNLPRWRSHHSKTPPDLTLDKRRRIQMLDKTPLVPAPKDSNVTGMMRHMRRSNHRSREEAR